MSQQLSTPLPLAVGQIACPTCEHENASWRSTCEQCRNALDALETNADNAEKPKRPLGLTLYIGFNILVALFLILMMVSFDAYREIFGIGLITFAIVDLTVAWGLWNLRNWARIMVIIFRSLAVALSIVGLLMGNIAAIGAIGISAFIVWWFVNNGHYFK